MESTEQTLAGFICNADLPQIATPALSTTRRVLTAVVGTGVAGAGEEGIAELRSLLQERGGKAQALSLVFGDRLPATSAALLNATMCRALDYCDAMAPGIHVGSSLVPAAFAAAELMGGCTGSEMLTALTVGAEIGARFNLSEQMYDGFDPTGIACVFAATAGAGRILKLDEMQMLNALALAFNRCGGSFQSNVDGSLAVRLIQGFVAETGVWCAQLAARGLTGPRNFIDGHYGYRHLYAKNLRAAASFTEGLGEQWLMNNFMFKKYPSCGVTQGVTEQTLEAIREFDLLPQQLESAQVRLPPYCWKLVGNPFAIGENPRVNAQFSAQYCVANAIYRRSSKLEHFTPKAVMEPELQALIARVQVLPDPAMDTRGHSSVDLDLHLKTGETIHKRYDVSPGYPGRPLSAAEHRARFDDCMNYAKFPLPSNVVASVLDSIERLHELPDVIPLWHSIIRL